MWAQFVPSLTKCWYFVQLFLWNVFIIRQAIDDVDYFTHLDAEGQTVVSWWFDLICNGMVWFNYVVMLYCTHYTINMFLLFQWCSLDCCYQGNHYSKYFRVSPISVMLIGLLFLLMFLFNGNLFNNTASTTPITVIQG